MSEEIKSLSARETVVAYIKSQVWGKVAPSENDSVAMLEPDDSGAYVITTEDEKKEHLNPENGLPFIRSTEPRFVFGTGILHPPLLQFENGDDADELESGEFEDEPAVVAIPQFESRTKAQTDADDSETFGLDRSQNLRPSAMGVSTTIQPGESDVITISVSGTTYSKLPVSFASGYNPQVWWKPERHSQVVEIPWTILASKPGVVQSHQIDGTLGEFSSLQTRVAPHRRAKSEGLFTFTTVLTHNGARQDPLYQFGMTVEVDQGHFVASSRVAGLDGLGLEEQEIEYQYRHATSFAVGHGISAHWGESSSQGVKRIFTESTPISFSEVLNSTIDGLDFDMQQLAEASAEETKKLLQPLIDSYSSWIVQEEDSTLGGSDAEKEVGGRLVDRARQIVTRMQEGLDALTSSPEGNALLAFQLANKAMYLQQQRGRVRQRKFRDEKNAPLIFENLELPSSAQGGFGKWRPFQIGFLLLTLSGLVDSDHPSREDVDLLYFPTGGGKTEAYLGAAAILMFVRRLEDSEHSGVDVLMRYTLRLLTIQQFERSAGLIVAMEHLRRQDPTRLGHTPFAIGVWLGNETTPNKRSDAVAHLKKRATSDSGANPFVLSKCPWCGSQFGFRKSTNSWIGYETSQRSPKTLRFQCPDRDNCEFATPSSALPIWITDEDVYDEKPSFILGTVDKFAQLAWEPNARALFNRNNDGDQAGLPPGLIIQDELHLISGPLGSMVGLYEAVIEDLCSYTSGKTVVRPKIIASTATTRRFREQVLSLFGREKTMLFPQAITRANETFFSSVSQVNGEPEKGTAFLGINPATYSTGQVSASQLAAIISQAPLAWRGESSAIDYYSSAVWFFNSLRELGQTLTLMQSTVLSLIQAMWRDSRIPADKSRSLEPMMELTGRISAAEVASSLERLGISAGERDSIVTCLASSIMEVGVDVQRLGLLVIMGQPKMASQYIQVAGRVGRAREKGPGLVIMLYNPSRARDRSIYEQFHSYHNRLYARVEPLSVTPFALQTLDKGLIGAILAHYRMTTPIDQASLVPDDSAFERSLGVLETRARVSGASDKSISDLTLSAERFRAKWAAYRPARWKYSQAQLDAGTEDMETALLRGSIKSPQHIFGDQSELIPTSMRTVDDQTFLLPHSNVYSTTTDEETQNGE